MFASQKGYEHVVEALIKGGATVDIQDEVIPVIVSPPPLCPHAYVHNVRSSENQLTKGMCTTTKEFNSMAASCTLPVLLDCLALNS